MTSSDYSVTDARIGLDGASSITWQNTCGLSVSDWVKTNKAIIAVFCNSTAHTPDAETFKLRWRNKTDNPTGNFVDLTDSGELQRGVSAGCITNGDPVGDGAGCETPIDDSEEVENESPLLTASLQATQNDYIETQWCVDFNNAHSGDEYEFELYGESAGASCGTVTPTITVESAIVELVGSLGATSDLTDNLMKSDMKLGSQDISGQSNTPSTNLEIVMKLLSEDIAGQSNVPDALIKMAMDLVGTLDGQAGLENNLLKMSEMKLVGTIDGMSGLTNLLLSLALDLIGSFGGLAGADGALTIITYKIEGVTRDSAGDPLGSCDVRLYLSSNDAYQESVVSNAVTGAYSFTGLQNNNLRYVIAYKTGTPVFGTTDDLTPVEE